MLSHTSAFQGADEQTRRRLFMHGGPALAVSFSDLSPDVSGSEETDNHTTCFMPYMSDSGETDNHNAYLTFYLSDSGETDK